MKKSLSILLVVLVIIALLLVALRVALPGIVRDTLNDKMANMGEDYRGEVEDVDLAIWRGAATLKNVSVHKIQDNEQVPFFQTPEADLSLRWAPLIREQILAIRIHLLEPELNFVDGPEEADQYGDEVDWRDTVKELLQVEIDEFHYDNGRVHFRNFTSDPPVNLYADNVNVMVYNLTNAEEKDGSRDARLEGTADFLDHAPVEAQANFDPLLRFDNFDARMRLEGLDLTRLNDFAAAYGNFDFKAGHGEVVMEVEAEESQLSGYIKPLLRDVEIFDFEQDVANEDKGFFRGVWEALVHGGEEVLSNPSADQFASRIELEGSLDDPEVSALQAFFAILRNAFVEAFSPQFERALGTGEEDS
ncbi:DUF748 domain-containing protein [Pseudomonas sp. OIL-1]|uniref:DUF748 domain-containing protein n=1 Tax=Pseudomonas sp. OIL-1 TaxID=2706126 RepID=UPI0013A751AA|nr:DUF748 domain-containing protein [Pseudomonas sp. OIL-1]QIB52076.1 DUF748 domain-containing protein [Pseudomonas sp. OIL-1]